MRALFAIAVLSLLGAAATAGLFFTGVDRAGSISLVLVCIAITSGFTRATGPLGNWGVPGDEK